MNADMNNYFPMGYYAEYTWRITPLSTSQPSFLGIVAAYRVQGTKNPSAWEADVFEISTNNEGGAWLYGDGGTEWNDDVFFSPMCGGDCESPHLKTDVTAYHKYGALWTTDAANVIYKKTYLDGSN